MRYLIAAAVCIVAAAVPTAVALTITEPAGPVPVVHTPEGLVLVVTARGYEPQAVATFRTEGECTRAMNRLLAEAPASIRVHCEVQS